LTLFATNFRLVTPAQFSSRKLIRQKACRRRRKD
jgi:hypothetical protein